MDQDETIQMVYDTFDASPLPGYDYYDIFEGHDPYTAEFLAIIKGLTWVEYLRLLEVPGEYKVQGLSDAIVFMTPAALRYFSPAILIFSFNPKSDVLPELFFGLLYVRGHNPDYREFFRRRIEVFTEQEKRVIGHVVQFYYGDGSSPVTGDAVLEYWKPWLPNLDGS